MFTYNWTPAPLRNLAFLSSCHLGFSEKSSLLIARITTIVTGLFGISFALSMSTWNIDSISTEFTKYIGIFVGGLGGLFLLAIFTRRSNSYGVIIGLFLSGLIQYFLKQISFAQSWSVIMIL